MMRGPDHPDSLRDRDDFKQLVAELDQATPTGKDRP
jgi:hypothetical protein